MAFLFPTNGTLREVRFLWASSIHVLTSSTDLNYRIDLPDPEVRELIDGDLLPHNRDALLEYDQVRHVKVKRLYPHFEPAQPLDQAWEIVCALQRRLDYVQTVRLMFTAPVYVCQISRRTYRFEVGPAGSGTYDFK
jgi:hypothetical protein